MMGADAANVRPRDEKESPNGRAGIIDDIAAHRALCASPRVVHYQHGQGRVDEEGTKTVKIS